MIRIVTDSACDITTGEARTIGIELISLSINFPGCKYDQTTDKDFSRFYQLLETEKAFPTTSQPPPEAFVRVFQAAKDAGDTVIAVLISSGLSGTLQSAKVAKETVGYSEIYLIDSLCAIMPQRMLVEYALKLRNAGEPADSIVRKVESVRNRIRVFGMIDTLTYLYKGGRLSRTVAIAGNLLHIRPLITANKEGVIALVGRGRNDQALINKLDEMGYDPDFPVYFGFTGDDTNAQRLMKHTLEKYPEIENTGLFAIGGLVGAHVGPRGMALAFVPR